MDLDLAVAKESMMAGSKAGISQMDVYNEISKLKTAFTPGPSVDATHLCALFLVHTER